jgi:hypothetical protein
MQPADQPTPAGIFNPAGSVIITLRTAAEQEAMAQALAGEGIAPADIARYSPDEMRAVIDAALPNAGPLAPFGQELKIAEERRALAVQGCSFLFIAPQDDDLAARLKASVNRLRAPTAQQYGWLVIEELTERTSGEVQVVQTQLVAT